MDRTTEISPSERQSEERKVKQEEKLKIMIEQGKESDAPECSETEQRKSK